MFFSPSERRDREPGFDADLATTWINTCRDQHGNCKGEQGGSRMPTRILDLSGSIESDFVLRATVSGGEDAEYACLSYKWGNTTTRLDVNFANLAKFMFDRPMSPQDRRLPPTFRDAIKVARSIGISYLWIDALCIWQDDDDDKNFELEKMNRYYANCTLVIQASGIDSVSEGFLDLAYRSRNLDVFANYLGPLPFRSSDGKEDTIYVCPGGKVDWYRKSDEPAAKRGWILQEETLCRRILIFPAGGGMIFRCDSRYMETDDGNVFYDPDVREHPRYWTKDRLLERSEDLSPRLITLSGRVNAMLEQVRSLSMVSGLTPTLWIKESSVGIRYVSNDDADGSSEGTCIIPVTGTGVEAAAFAKTIAVIRQAGSPDTLVHTRTPPGVALPNELHDIWKHLVTDYCARDLTKPSDKLIAIDGLAREFQERYGSALGSYHSGLWSKFLPAGLIWRSIRPASPDAEFSVPSWSWAAVQEASYPDPGRLTGQLASDGANFKDVDIRLSSFVSAEEGGVEVEQIRLVAKLLDVWWGPDTTPQQKMRRRLPQAIMARWKSLRNWLVEITRLHKHTNKRRAGEKHKLSKEDSPSSHTGNNPPAHTTQGAMSEQEVVSYALFQEDGTVLTTEVHPDHSTDLPICGRESVTMMLGRRYVTGVGHDQDNSGEVLLLRKRENGTYVRVAFAEMMFRDFEEVWEPRFEVNTIVLA